MLVDTVKQLKQRKIAIRSEIAKLNAEDRNLDRAIKVLSTLPVSESAPAAKPAKKLPAATIAKMRIAAKARWVARKAKAAAEPVKKRTMSAAAIAKIRAAQKARWAKINAAKTAPTAAKPATPAKKRKISAAGRAAIIAAQKARWAKIKAAKAEAAATK